MLITVFLFWFSFIVLFFCYVGYGLLLFFFNGLKRLFVPTKQEMNRDGWLPVTMIVPAFNESAILEQKIQNTLAIDYPAGMVKIIFVTDGSTDGSAAIVEQYSSILLLHQHGRKGKMAAIKRAMEHVRTPVVVFSDANAMLNKACIQKMMRHYDDAGTGGVAGEKKIIHPERKSAIGEAEGIYWNYESFMKKQDAAFNTIIGAAGELYSIRTELFPQLNDDVILDDFVISMKICLRGYKIRYEPGAFATELPSASLQEEKKRKIRISAGAYQSIPYLKSALNVFRHPALSFQYSCRRLFRWTLCPLLLIVLFVSNLLIVVTDNSPEIYVALFIAQLSFYLLAVVGWLIILSGWGVAVFTLPFYFVFMNYCLVGGLIKFLKGKQTVLWEKSLRQARE
jgi:poly-beta-1,6-N-acetyl-D-glucosamine synthase